MLMETPNPFEGADVETMIGMVSSVFSELNIGLLIYHLEDPDDPRSLRLVYANRMASEYTGADLSRAVGLNIVDAFPGLAETDLPERYAGVATTKQSRNIGAFEYGGDERVNRGYFSVKAFPMPKDCVGVVFENITVRKQLEEMVRKLRERE